MRIINDIGDATLTRAMQAQVRKPCEDMVSVTQLIDSPRVVTLTRRHWDEIEAPASKQVAALYGSCIHDMMEVHGVGELREERLYMKHMGVMVTGAVDYYGDRRLVDYKTMSSQAKQPTEPKDEWAAQLNLYVTLLEHNGYGVDLAFIKAIARDWSPAWSSWERPTVMLPVDIDGPEKRIEDLEWMIAEWQAAASLEDDELPPCLPSQRWHKPPRYAVTKEGNKRATKVYDTKAEAEADAESRKPKLYRVEERGGEDTRCLHYCDVAEFCDHGKAVRAAAAETYDHAFTGVNGEG